MKQLPLVLSLLAPLAAQQPAPVPQAPPAPIAAPDPATPAAQSDPDLSLLGGSLERSGVTSLQSPPQPKNIVWKMYIGTGQILPLSIAEGKVWVVRNGESRIQGIDQASGKELFTYEADQNLFSAPLVANGALNFGTKRFGLAGGNCKYWVVDIATKTVKQKESYGFMVEIPTPTITKDRVYHVGATFTGNTRMICANPSGKEIWSQKIGIVMPGLYAMDESHAFFVVYQKWSNGPSGAFFNLNETSVTLLAQDLKTGGIMWDHSMSSRCRYPVVSDHSVLLGSRDALIALSSSKGEELWSLGDKGANFAPPVVAKGVVVAGTASGWVYGVQVQTGKVLWKTKLEGPAVAQPSIAGELVLVPVATKDGNGFVQALDLEIGQEKWRLKCDPPVTPILATADGIIFGTSSGEVVSYR